jgi:hypothetical protein
MNLSSIASTTVISFLIEIFLRLDTLSTPFCAPNAVLSDFILETNRATRKTQSFADFDENCYFFPDWDISAFRSPFDSILRAERIALPFLRRNKPCNSQNSIFPRHRRKLLFLSWLRYYGVFSLFPLHSTRRTHCTPISASKQAQ